MSRQCSRRLEFDAAHRVMRHESKCSNLHGHRYVVEVTAISNELDDLGRVIDFGLLKQICGSWLDEHWDHGLICHKEDVELIKLCNEQDWKIYILQFNPTAENMCKYLFHKFQQLLYGQIRIAHIRIYETPNCWADYGEE